MADNCDSCTTDGENLPPLHGIRVIDLGQGVAGPYCGQLLADHGADVIKVEPPRGDWSRPIGARHEHSGLSSTFIAVNRNKRGICLDLKDPEAIAALRRLVLTSDVLVESFRPGVMDRLGLGYDNLRADLPNLVYCSVTGFGANGPNVGAAASDSMMQAYAGLMSIVGEHSGPPMRIGTVVSDMLAGENAFSAVLLALLRRGKTSLGSRVEVDLLGSLLSLQSTGIVDYLVSGTVPQRSGSRHPQIGASGVTRTRDGWLALGVLDHYWSEFVELLDEESVRDPRFTTSEGRMVAQNALWESLDSIFAARSTDAWLAKLRPAGIICGPVQDYSTLVRDPQVVHNGYITSLANGAACVDPPQRLDGTAITRRTDPPQLGQHTRQVLMNELRMDLLEYESLVGRHCAIESPD